MALERGICASLSKQTHALILAAVVQECQKQTPQNVKRL